MFFIVSCIFMLIFGLANVFIYKRLFMKIPFLQAHRFWVLGFVLVIFVMEFAFLMFRADDRFNSTIYNVLAHSFAFTYFFFFVTLFAEILAFFIRFWVKKTSKLPLNPQRRSFIKLIFNFSLLIFGIGLVLRGWGNAMNVPAVKQMNLSLKGLKNDLRLVMISDVHLGKNLHDVFLGELVAKINGLKPDIVVIVGDLIDTKPKELEHYIHKLNDLQSKLGTFYVLGNHEYYRGLDEVLRVLRTRTNLKILINESVDLGEFNIAGLADLAGLRFANDEKGVGLSGLGPNSLTNFTPDIKAATSNLSLNKPSILLSHQPKSVNVLDVSAFDLVLSGHTHAGQVFPFGALVLAQQGFLYGLYELSQKTKLYVSSGAGFWGPAIRFLAPSEIVLMQIKAEA
ncbi:metallophosphoesterase [Campylobacter sp. MIT 12-5580]|uniref:metallophosphoesterase n=1 Tax=Campylobacter sp. MIT 12-5580 TaxID=2040651 RepID=UPI0010F9D5D3|nr:metallophosphoesterase [Campylobacter sp. MIT 12-5580]TKX29061.1 metallophosphoesterase [Campylobacter sp. MIT 12-5580]